MRNLITGIHGFAASHLSDLLLARNEKVFGIARVLENDGNIRHIADRIKVFPCDVRVSADLKKIVENVRPHRIYHMASVSFVPAAAQDWEQAFETNVFGTLHLFEAVKQLKLDARIMCVGSSEEYGAVVSDDMPIREKLPLQPFTLYGVTKAAADILSNSFVKRERLDILRVRPFNHIGPRQKHRFVCPSIARQIAQFEAGKPPVLKIGNLDAQRDFTDVRDTVRAYHAVMEKGVSGEVYNVCSGKTVSIKSIVETFRRLASVSFQVENDPSRSRAEQPLCYWGDHSFLTERTGWTPKIPLEDSLKDILGYWRENL
ncbi:MAG: GDP-mannose 4,6-dehydratase [Nitrospinales bacterium]